MNEDSLEPKIQLYLRRGKVVLRAVPTGPPTEPQRAAREAFARAARRARGAKMTEGLPPAAAQVRRETRGLHFGHVERLPRWKVLLLRTLREKGLSDEQARAALETLD